MPRSTKKNLTITNAEIVGAPFSEVVHEIQDKQVILQRIGSEVMGVIVGEVIATPYLLVGKKRVDLVVLKLWDGEEFAVDVLEINLLQVQR